jgi:hypothetical protein
MTKQFNHIGVPKYEIDSSVNDFVPKDIKFEFIESLSILVNVIIFHNSSEYIIHRQAPPYQGLPFSLSSL